ncbi:MAG TPA: S8 family serine peptidase [Trebonia sp.]|nr:S8 family serine peptidase [Trebonia sp.]
MTVPGCLLAASAPPARAATMPATGTPSLAAEWWLGSLGVPAAWKALAGGRPGAGVTVAVLSTGVDPAHPDLTGSVTTGPDLSGSGARSGDPYWGQEGTAVASLIAGHGHGSGHVAGITGVAPGARILSLRVTLEYNDPRNAKAGLTRPLPGAIASGIRYAVSHGARVIALPLDPGTLGALMAGDPSAAGGSAAERAAVAAAVAAGVVLVAPAGDNGASTGSVNYPAAYPGVISVGATSKGGQREAFSSTRPYVALTAPGSGLTVAAPPSGYATITTTDMSAALTAGVAALIRARYPRLSGPEVVRAIVHAAAARPAGAGGPGTGTGPLSATRALAAAGAIAAKLPPPAAASSAPAPASASPTQSGAGLGLAASPPATARLTSPQADAGGTATAILRDAAIGAGVLIVALVVLLFLARARRRRARAERLSAAPGPAAAATRGQPRSRPPLAAHGAQPALPSRAATGGHLAAHGHQGAHATRTTHGYQAITQGGAAAPGGRGRAATSSEAAPRDWATRSGPAAPGDGDLVTDGRWPAPGAHTRMSHAARPGPGDRDALAGLGGRDRAALSGGRAGDPGRRIGHDDQVLAGQAADGEHAVAADGDAHGDEDQAANSVQGQRAFAPRPAGDGAAGGAPGELSAPGSPGPGTSERPGASGRPGPWERPGRMRPGPIERPGSLRPSGRPPFRLGQSYDTAPWAPARMPAAEIPPGLDEAPDRMMRPPWEGSPGSSLAAAPVPADMAGDDPGGRKSHSGPMYVWDPTTNSGPFPAARDQPPGD